MLTAESGNPKFFYRMNNYKPFKLWGRNGFDGDKEA